MNDARRRNYAVLLVLVAIVLIGISQGPYLSQPIRVPDYQFQWEMTDDPDSLDPHVCSESSGKWVIFNVYETLYTYPWGNSTVEPLVPLLAVEMPEVSPDGINYTVRLRQEIDFHDGTPFNASCVKWNFERAMKISYTDGPSWMLADALRGGRTAKDTALSNGTSSIEFRNAFEDWVLNSGAVEVIDTYQIRFVLEEPYSPFIQLLAHSVCSIMSPSYVLGNPNNDTGPMDSHWGVDYGEVHTWMQAHTCGTGPYQLEEWRFDEFLKLVLSEEYWRAGSTETAIAPSDYSGSITEVFLKVNKDTTGRLLNLRTGLADGVNWPTANAIEIWDNVTMGSREVDIVVSTTGMTFDMFFLGFNMGNVTTPANSSIVSPFKNRNMRRAASFVFDYEQFIRETLDGFGVQAKGPIPQGIPGHDSSDFEFEFNVTAAVEEWNLAMQDPQFVNSLNGLNNTLTFYHIAKGEVQAKMLLVSGLREMYVDPAANHTGLDNDMVFETVTLSPTTYARHLEERKLLLIPIGWSSNIAHSADSVRALCYHTGHWARAINYNNTEVSGWYESVLAEINTVQQNVYSGLIQEVVANDVPYIWASQRTEFRTTREWLKGNGLTFNPMHDVYIYETRKEWRTYPDPEALGHDLAGVVTLVQVLLAAIFVVLSFSTYREDMIRIRIALFVSYSMLTIFNAVLFAVLSPPIGQITWARSMGGMTFTFVLGHVFVPISLITAIAMYYDTKSRERGSAVDTVLLLLIATLLLLGFFTTTFYV
ncbi:MAG: ABC transporter substrate-binding protein [Promethearchaeota archaeon]